MNLTITRASGAALTASGNEREEEPRSHTHQQQDQDQRDRAEDPQENRRGETGNGERGLRVPAGQRAKIDGEDATRSPFGEGARRRLVRERERGGVG